MHAWQKRIEIERQKAIQFPLLPTEDPTIWNSVLPGPTGTPYSGAKFVVEIRISSEYPFKAPYVKFLSPIYHANIHESGIPYCPLVLNEWSASKSLQSIMLFLENLLKYPVPAYAYNSEAGDLLLKDRCAYEITAQAYLSKILTVEQTTTDAPVQQTSD